MRRVLLPGLDGTGTLFKPFLDVLPDIDGANTVAYPMDGEQTYTRLTAWAHRELPTHEPFVIVAESFSGPIAMRLAAARPKNLRGLVLVASFARPPLPSGLRHAVRAAFFRQRIPGLIARYFLTGARAPQNLVRTLQDAVGSVPPAVLTARARQALTVDARGDLQRIDVPILFLAPTKDRLVRYDREQMLALNPRIEWVEVNAPHMVLQVCPEKSAEVIEEFVRQLSL